MRDVSETKPFLLCINSNWGRTVWGNSTAQGCISWSFGCDSGTFGCDSWTIGQCEVGSSRRQQVRLLLLYLLLGNWGFSLWTTRTMPRLESTHPNYSCRGIGTCVFPECALNLSPSWNGYQVTYIPLAKWKCGISWKCKHNIGFGTSRTVNWFTSEL